MQMRGVQRRPGLPPLLLGRFREDEECPNPREGDLSGDDEGSLAGPPTILIESKASSNQDESLLVQGVYGGLEQPLREESSEKSVECTLASARELFLQAFCSPR